MALPKIKVAFRNGMLGTVTTGEDGVLLLCAKGTAVANTLKTDKAYKIYRLSGLDELGAKETTHAALYKAVKQFYAEAPEGTPLYVAVYSDASMSAFCDKDSGKLRSILQSLKGAVRGVVILHPDEDKAGTVETGLSKDVFTALPKAQKLGEWTAEELYAPVFIVLDGYAYTGNATELKDVSKETSNRVMIFLGSESPTDKHTAIGYVAGRIAKSPVQRNIGRVKDGSISVTELYLGSKSVEEAMDDVSAIYEKGYVTPRVHVGRSGYYFTDDRLVVAVTDDYAHLTARRTIDKVLRIAYDTLLNGLLDEVELNDDGTMQEPIIRSWEAEVEKAVNASMTASGELAAADGSGVECSIDASQNVRATSTLEVTVAARPFGYPRTIVANLGFKVE